MFKYVKVLFDNYLHEYHADLQYLICLTRNWTLSYLKVLSQAAQKVKFSMKDFFSKCDKIRSFQSHLLNEINEKLHFLSSVRNPYFVNRLKLLPCFLKHSTQASRSGKVIDQQMQSQKIQSRHLSVTMLNNVYHTVFSAKCIVIRLYQVHIGIGISRKNQLQVWP